MPAPSGGRTRSDAARNRERLLAVAADVFARGGPDVPLEEFARAAGVSRTTLHRHFPTRAALATAVYQRTLAHLEEAAAACAGDAAAVVALFHTALDVQLRNPGLAGAVSRADVAGLARRTADALDGPLRRGRAAGVVHDDVEVQDVMSALPMAASVLVGLEPADRAHRARRLRVLLHRALFTTPVP